ncbi:hypothetical protein ACFLQW_01185 [Candidatus Zixiibacteriota bacterium]
MLSLSPDYRSYIGETDKLRELLSHLTKLDPPIRKLVAEITLLRLFDLLVNFMSTLSAKVACGTRYLDNTPPVLLARASSMKQAKYFFERRGRGGTIHNLRWTKARYIKENIKYVVGSNDNLVMIVDRYGSEIEEIRRIRNRIAHNNENARKKYRDIVKRHYGAHLNFIGPGTLLLTPKKSPCLLEQYIVKSRIIVKDLTKT